MILLQTSLMVFLSKLGQFILCFSILVVLHELGHFIPAKLFKCKVEKFYLFFNPWFSIFKKKIGETEYGLGWIPFGGYVKIAGMVDESMDKDQLNKPIEDYEFRSKPAWQRLIIMLGGVFVNILLAIGIFIMIVYIWGTSYLPTDNIKLGIAGTELALQNGFKEGDKLISVNNIPQLKFDNFENKILDKSANTIEVLRNNKIEIIPISENLKNNFIKDKNKNLFFPHTLLVINSINKKTKFGYNAIALQKGDTILTIDNKNTTDILQFNMQKKMYKDVFVPLKIKRNSDTFITTIYADSKSVLNLEFESFYDKLNFSREEYSFLSSIPTGYNICKNTLNQYVSSLGDIFTGKINPNESLGSIISIGKTFPDKLDWERFWTLTAIFSIILAFMNVLPIPALDGGHALFIFIELITRKKPSDKFMERAQIVGMILLMSLMVYALGLDFWRLFK